MLGAGSLVDLSVTPFAEVLRMLSAEQRTGDLLVRSGKVVKTVFFDHGRVVFAASNLKKDRLGDTLVDLGRITSAEFEQASALMRADRKRRFGDALVQSGVLGKDEVGRLVARQVKRIVGSLFELAEGAASFEERPCPIPLEYMVSVSVHRLLYVGIRSMASQRLVLAGMGDLDRWVRLAEVPPFRFGVRKCSQEEMEILELAKRRATLRRLAWATGGLALPRLRASYALLASGVLEDAERPSAQPIVQMETSTFLLSALQRRPDPQGREAVRREVEEELARSANLDRQKWLRLSRSAPQAELARALEEKMERYHALLDAVGDEPALRTDIELILGRAASMLRLARLSPRTSEVLAPDSEAAPATPPGGAPDDASVGTETLAATPTPAHGKAGEMIDVSRLVTEGHIRMTVADYANAVRVYQQLVELAPDVAVHHLRLAIAMACHPATKRQAERQFLEALGLDPSNPDIHFQFALYYDAMKVRSRAVAELRTTLHLNPRHPRGRAKLEEISPGDPALTSLKKQVR
jgi:tetratricopeptide (TPR) repeat protein